MHITALDRRQHVAVNEVL